MNSNYFNFHSPEETCNFLDVPLFQPDSLEFVLVFPALVEKQQENHTTLCTVLNVIENEFLGSQFKDHIWHKESLRTRVAYSTSAGGYYLHSISHYGGCVDDEWLMIHIMYQLTLRFPGLIVRITDTDGDVLLIEAAEELPDWMEPENTRNRAWLYRGKLVVIPPEYGNHEALGFSDALAYLQTRSPETVIATKRGTDTPYYHNPALDLLAFERIHVYPKHAQDLVQRSNIYVPRKVAAILHSNPQIIALVCQQLEEAAPGELDESGMPSAASVETLAEKLSRLQHIPLKLEETEEERELSRDSMSENSESSMVLFAAKFTKHIYATFMADPSNPPPWFPAFVPDDEGVSYEASMLGTKVTGSLDLLLREHVLLNDEIEIEGEEGGDDDALFAERLGQQKELFESLPYMKNSEKENMFHFLFYGSLKKNGKTLAEDVNVVKFYKDLKSTKGLPTNREVQEWDKTVDSNKWFYEMLRPGEEEEQGGSKEEGRNRKQESKLDGEEGEFGDMKQRLGGLFSKVQEYMTGEESDDSSSSDEEEEEEKKRDEEHGKDTEKNVDIDEDDFFEFFLKEALKLSPEEIEQYRSNEGKKDSKTTKLDATSNNRNKKTAVASFRDEPMYYGPQRADESDDSSLASEEEDAYTRDELQSYGILNEQEEEEEGLSASDYEAMLNLLSSMTAGGSNGQGAPGGPAAAMFTEMGLDKDPMFQKMMGFGGKMNKNVNNNGNKKK